MTNKARFLEQQPKYKFISGVESDDMVRVFICLNEKEIEEKYEYNQENPVHCYEYDYNEFIDYASNLDLDDIKNNPENYLDYEPVQPATDSEKIQAQVMYTAMMTDTVLED